MKFGIVVFPGSNCDHDCYHVLAHVLGQPCDFLWHKQACRLDDYSCIILPGGFSYGDYLRAGAIAQFSPILRQLPEYAGGGGLVLGICNGFQILLELGLLPGAMRYNRSLRFICREVYVRVENVETPYTKSCRPGQVLSIPIAHMEGNYYADEAALGRLKAHNQVVLRYCTPQGEITPEANPNGALENIAGICNERGNVLGMMPHPERCSEAILGLSGASSGDGRLLFESVIRAAVPEQ